MKNRFRKLISCSLVMVFILTSLVSVQPARAAATTYFVGNDCVVPVCAGTGWIVAFPTLQQALSVAVSGDQVWVEAGTYYPDEGTGQVNNDRASTFTLKNGVRIFGGFNGTETQLSQRNISTNSTILSGDIDKNDVVSANGFTPIGSNAYQVVTATSVDTTAILDGFTVQQGNANGLSFDGVGGGIYVNDGDPTLRNLKIFSNQTQGGGGGMYVFQGAPRIVNVLFDRNFSAHKGGGLYNYLNSPSILTNVTFVSNHAVSDGGGMFNASSMAPVLNGVTFETNIADGNGGGMYNFLSASATLTNVTFFSNNAANYGGGLYHEGNILTLNTVDFTSNTTDNNQGGGMYSINSSPTLTGVSFVTNHAAASGGGMVNNNSDAVLTDVVFDDNLSDLDAGGMLNFESSPTLTNVTIIHNNADSGAGMFNNSNSAPVMTNVVIRNNDAIFEGGGMLNQGNSAPILTNVMFDTNFASNQGGGMYNAQSAPSLTNVTFYNNNTNGQGGGMYNTQSSPTLMNVTFAENYADDSGDGIHNQTASHPKLKNTIIANGNFTGDCINSVDSSLDAASSNNLIQNTGVNACSLVHNINGNIIGADPTLGPRQDNGGFTETVAPLPDSPVIDKGTNAGCPTSDQRGFSRPLNGDGVGAATCDIGAVETIGQLIVRSSDAQDGWILESSETSGQGGTSNASVTTFRVGDDAQDRQFRSILAFNTTALPDNAIITKVTLRILFQAKTGTSPYNTHGNLVVDIRKGGFSDNNNLQTGDFQAKATTNAIGTIPNDISGWFSKTWISDVFTHINPTGHTQFRLRFQTDDNDDGAADFLSFFSGDATLASRPQLIIEYRLP